MMWTSRVNEVLGAGRRRVASDDVQPIKRHFVVLRPGGSSSRVQRITSFDASRVAGAMSCASTLALAAPARARARASRVSAEPRRAARACAAASSGRSALPETIAEALEQCESHVAANGANLYAATPELTAAVSTMVASKKTGGRSVAEILEASDGVWEVFHMPHMYNLSSPLGITFRPVRYTLKGGKIRSDVRFDARGAVRGWLDSAGTVKRAAQRDDAVELAFDAFWVGRDGDRPRDSPVAEREVRRDERLSPADAVINNIGRAGFLPSFAVFPVHFFDEERGLCIFEFPPMRSFIAAARVSRDVDDVVF